jgi:hypothetical protein
MNEFETLRLKCHWPYQVWVYYRAQRKELYCPLGNQPAIPLTTHIYWSAINEVEKVLEKTGLAALENPPAMPGNFLVCFRTKELAEKFRIFAKIEKKWASTKVFTEAMMKDAIGNVPFIVYFDDYIDDGRGNASGFRWKVWHAIKMDNRIAAGDLDGE